MSHCRAASRAPGPRVHLSDVLAEHAPAAEALTAEQARVIRDLISCRTAALGGRLERCDRCGHENPVYNSCRNRHCPRCQSFDAARWVQRRSADLLPVPYFHLVFTVPACLRPLFRAYPRACVRLLFQAVGHALVQVIQRHLGATPGCILVLHTWTQALDFHPHVHCLVTGGGLTADGTAWIRSRPRFLVPVRKLSCVFRAMLLAGLRSHFNPRSARIADLLRRAEAQKWVVYSKAPLAGPEQVLRYLGRYTHRTAISEDRLLTHESGIVRFRCRDRLRRRRSVVTVLSGPEFVRRFLLHVVPPHLVRIRYYGLLANAFKARRLREARDELHASTPVAVNTSWESLYRDLTGRDPFQCPRCQQGTLRTIELIPIAHSGRSP